MAPVQATDLSHKLKGMRDMTNLNMVSEASWVDGSAKAAQVGQMKSFWSVWSCGCKLQCVGLNGTDDLRPRPSSLSWQYSGSQ